MSLVATFFRYDHGNVNDKQYKLYEDISM